MYPAMSQTDNLKCPSCAQVYSVRDMRGHMLPRILKCGHTCCEACIRSRASQTLVCTCPVCEDEQKFATISSIQALLLDSYTMGVGAANLRPHQPSSRGPDLDPLFGTMRRASRSKEVASKGPVVLCDECGHRPASCGCDTCPSNFCKPCYEEIHGRAKTMRKHKPKTLRAVSVAAEMAAVCEAHKRVREFFCVTDNVLICPLCLVTGDQHKDHTVVPMAEQDAKALPQLKSALDEAQKSYQGLKKTSKKLRDVSKGCEGHVKSQVDAVHAHFQHLHCLLELRMHHLLAGIRKVGAEHVQSIEQQLGAVESKIEEFKDIQKDALAAIANSNPEHTSFLLERMKAFSSMPCFITGDTESHRPVLEVQYELPLSELLKSYGKLRFTLPEKLSLVPVKDLPEGYLEEEELDNTDADSVSSVETPGAALSVASDDASVPEQNNSKRVKVTHIRDLSCFFVQPTRLDAKLKKMQSEIRDYCRIPDTRPLREDEVVVGELYLAQYKMDRVWYRCRALRTVEGDTTILDGTSFRQSSLCVEVLYIDYGNSEVIPLGRMRRMSPRFDKLGPVAIKCSLYNVVPVGNSPVWKRESGTVFGKLTHNKKLILREVKRTPSALVVDLVDDSVGDCGEVQTSISDALVFLGVASYHMPPLTAPVAETAGAVRRRYYPPVELLAGQVTSVIVSCIYSPHKLFVQQLGSHARSLHNLLVELQAHCKKESSELDLVFVPREGLPCLSLFPSDRLWYRARIVGVPSESRVQVVYVDYGNEETVAARSLRRMPEQFMHLPQQALPVRLADVAPASGDGTWSDAAKERLVQVTSTHRLIMKVHGSSGDSEYTKVALYVPGNNEADVCINALLVKEGLANSTGPLSLMENVPSLRTQLPPHQRSSLVDAMEETIMINKQHKRLTASTAQSRPPLSNVPKRSSVSSTLATMDAHLTEPPKAAAPPPALDRPREEYVPVQVTHVESPVKFYVRMLDERKSFEKLHKRLQSTGDIGSSSGGAVQVPWVGGQWCAAKHGGHRVRGIVVSVVEEAVTVRLVDSGKHADIRAGDLSPLPLELTLTPPLARPCHLADMIPAGGSQHWCKTAEECFVELLSTKNRIFVVHMGEMVDGSLPVDVIIEEIIEPGALEPMRKEYRSARTKLQDMGYGFVVKKSAKEVSFKSSTSAAPEGETSTAGSGVASSPDQKPVVPDSTPDKEAPAPAEEDSRVSHQEMASGLSSTKAGEKDDNANSDASNASPPSGGKVVDCEAAQPEGEEAVQLQSPGKEQPECAGAVHSEKSEAVELQHSAAVNGGGAESVQLDYAQVQVATSAVTGNEEPKEVVKGKNSSCSEIPAGDGDKNPIDLFVIQDEQELFKWKPRSLPNQKQMLVMPSHIDEDAVIYAQVLGKDIDLYMTVKETLFEAYNQRPKPVHRTLHIGQACIARYSADLKFYRALILNVSEKGVEVRFVDYGTSEYANPDDIYTDLMFEDLPVLCIEAELYGLKPFSSDNTWPLKTLDGLHYMLVEKRCSLVVKEPPTATSRAQVHLFLPDGVAVHDVLLEAGLAYRLPESLPVQQLDQEPREPAEVIPWPYQARALPEQGAFPVLVTNLEAADVAFVQRCKYAQPSTEEEEAANSHLDEFFAMTEELQEVADHSPLLQDTAVGTPCIGKYSYDQLWYRGLIAEHKNKKKVTVFYVDYGNSETLAKSSLRVLPEKFLAVPVQAHKCRFHGVQVKRDPSQALTRLSQILFEKDNTDFLAEIKNKECFPVEIDLMNSALELVYEPLVEEGFITIDRGGAAP